MRNFYFVIILINLVTPRASGEDKKNLIAIFVDDLGFHDLSFRGSGEIPTFNIDALAYNGILLNKFYTPSMPLPSRAAFMTGNYPHHTTVNSLLDNEISLDELEVLMSNEKIIPEYFKESGYRTRLIGKWSLGFYQEKNSQKHRGFDSFFGYLDPLGIYNYTNVLDDFTHDFAQIASDVTQMYATEMFTKEAIKVIKNHDKDYPLYLQINHLEVHAATGFHPTRAKPEDVDKFLYIENPKRKHLAAMIYAIDESVGQIIQALKDNKMLEDSIIFFASSNGGPSNGLTESKASNFPLRGQKQSALEGGIRTNAIIYSPSLPRGAIRNQMIYVADLLPTFSTLTGANFKISSTIDGLDQTNVLLQISPEIRKEIVTVDALGFSSYIYNGYKMVNGTPPDGLTFVDGMYDIHLGSNNNSNHNAEFYIDNVLNSQVAELLNSTLNAEMVEELRKRSTVRCGYEGNQTVCDLTNAPCLFDIITDPCEQKNLANELTEFLMELSDKFYLAIDDGLKSFELIKSKINLDCGNELKNVTLDNDRQILLHDLL